MIRRAAWTAAFALAALAALVPLPARVVERWYSLWAFPLAQHAVTPLSNVVPFALFDVLWAGATAAVVILARRRVGALGWKRGLFSTGASLLRAAAIVYLAFLATWGLNYRRVPMAEKVVFDPARVTRAAGAGLGDWAAAEMNAQYAVAHAGPYSLPALGEAFDDAISALGSAPIVHARPKQTLLGWYFHKASIAGMTDPFLLETMLAPDLLQIELPFVVAHEWAHLAGYADESEANFVAYLACRRGDGAARYSGALTMVGYARPSRPIREVLDAGPQSDLAAIQSRYRRTSPTLRFAARQGYDTYLRANRVQKGVESYDAVVQLILGTSFDARGNPRLR